MVFCVHHIPGRARFKVSELHEDPALAPRLEEHLQELDCVDAVEIHKGSASVIVHYCTETGEIELIHDQLCAHCPRAALKRRAAEVRPALAPRPAHRDADALADAAEKAKKAVTEAASRAVVSTFINRVLEQSILGVAGR